MSRLRRQTCLSAGPLLATLALAGCGQESPLSPSADLTAHEWSVLKTFALTPLPPDPSNAVADLPAAARLGQKFFFDTRFAGPLGPANGGPNNGSLGRPGEVGKVACASCHDPASGGTDHRSRPEATSLAAGWTARNAPTVINAAYSPTWQFWDGRKDSQWSQALGPAEAATEQNGSRLRYAHMIYDHYRAEYETIFGPLPDLSATARFPAEGKPGDRAFDAMSAADQQAISRVYSNFGKAIAAYERRLVSASFSPSAFDRYLAGDAGAMSPAAIRGAKLFVGRASCNECHNGAVFSDFKFHNIGVPQVGDTVPALDRGRMDGITAVKGDPFNRAGAFSDAPDAQELVALQPHPADLGAFKTPTLRNVSRTAPYMHDGFYHTLWDVLQHYRFGGATGRFAGTKDPSVVPLPLSDRDLEDLVEYLTALADGPPLDPDLVRAPVLP
jgi:cytochrome c peroxidase